MQTVPNPGKKVESLAAGGLGPMVLDRAGVDDEREIGNRKWGVDVV